ncbi:MAG TPA: GNAT family N-acetyltransferase [Mycobacteriales bacterium]|nr:GNAT family N-acetyltransferase [Mycobacteriales bacterium]
MVRLRDVQLGDVETYVRMRCDPVMMAELGGPLPRAGIEDKVRRDVESTASGETWIEMILPSQADLSLVAGSVVLWSHEHDGVQISEIGWMVLPEFQGRGLGTAAVRALLARAGAEDRWGPSHAFPGVHNAPSNGICRTLGFTLLGAEQVIAFGDRPLPANHWRLDPHGLDPHGLDPDRQPHHAE